MTRLPLLMPVLPHDDQRGLYESIAGGRRAGGPQHLRLRHDDGSLTGPFNALLHAPELGAHGSQLGEGLVGYVDLLSTVLDAFAVGVPEGAGPFEAEGEA